mmetsp:Transcript_23022/g.19988  ORF Transcript_23022/g.19988 Transcript_23022/m.19988 type:complete len:325 (+) Transcript_23022:84-1058(+)
MNSKELNKTKQRTVFFDNDGGLDDILCLVMLLQFKNVKLIGCALTPANCFMEPALECSLKVFSLFGREDLQIARAHHYGVHQFPAEWRAYPVILNNLPLTINQTANEKQIAKEEGPEFLIKCVKESKEKVTLLLTGPCSNLAVALEKDPSIKDNIEEVVIMGGAVHTEGNVSQFNHNGSAEWNLYYDPFAAKKVLNSGLNISLFTLDATNKCPLNKDLFKNFGKLRDYTMANFVSCALALTTKNISSYSESFFLWDPMTAAYLGCDGLCSFKEVELEVETDAPNQGRTVEKKGGAKVNICDDLIGKRFEEFYLDIMKANFPNLQ